ncbi:cupin domain-containing protein [Nocardia ignorata]|uniref:Cupin domain n=1 Tax=Nocardia ignorata TaxID=145285 RepID=A0A4R6P6Y0_NOCIG|nr:cupin domain-containing protein [Nocardia ignorata]TDP32850.1 cupin domain [Nocardia ignorata]
MVVPLTDYPGRMQVLEQILGPNTPRLVTHAGYEWLYVLAGDLRLILGEQDLLLRPGEVAEFDADQPHWFGPADDRSVEIPHMFGPQGGKARVRTPS